MGDLGKRDDRGNLMIVGRKKEMIIRGGQNIYPIEIEEMMLGHEKVRETAIVGIPDDTMGQRVCVCIVQTSPNEVVTLEEVVDFLKKRGVSSYKLPERLEVIDQMPMESGGQKVDRKALRDNVVQRRT
jgi:non-ribosomal peptide synthetase component E (peptide arylation enzyme)